MSDRTEGKDFSGRTIRNIDFSNAKIVGANLQNTRMSGMIDGLVVNDIEVAPLIGAEMRRRYPELAKLKPMDAAGFPEAILIVEGQLEATYERALGFIEEERHQRVDEEWSIVETIRHVIYVLDGWFSRTVRGEENPFHEIGLPPSFIPRKPEGTNIDPDANPTFEEARDVLRGRVAAFRDYLLEVTPEELSRPVDAWTKAVHGSLWVILDELWAHNRFANRDLDAIESSR